MSLRIGIGDVYQYQIPLFLSSALSRYIIDFIRLVSKYHIQVQELEYSVICHAFPMMHRYACHVSVFIEIIGRTRQTLWGAVQMLTQKHVAKRYIISQKVVPLHHETERQYKYV